MTVYIKNPRNVSNISPMVKFTPLNFTWDGFAAPAEIQGQPLPINEFIGLSGEANNLRSTYIDGFLDVSSSRGVLLRSDVSFGGNVVLSRSNFTGTVTPNSTAATSSTWSNNGITWISSASSVYDSNYSVSAPFNNDPTGSRWSSSAVYTNGTGAYAGSTTTTVGNSVGTVNGEWLQIQSSVPVVMKDFKRSSYGFPSRFPKSFYIVGSNTGSGTWTPILYGSFSAAPATDGVYSGTITIPSGTASSQTMTVNNGTTSVTLTYNTYGNSTSAFTYFRMVITATFSDAIVDLAEWNINFTPFTPATSAITLAPSTTAYGQLNLTGGFTQLGIGTATPSQPLHVQGAAYISGNVGIGTTNPQQTLDVNGNIYSANTLGNIHRLSNFFTGRIFTNQSKWRKFINWGRSGVAGSLICDMTVCAYTPGAQNATQVRFIISVMTSSYNVGTNQTAINCQYLIHNGTQDSFDMRVVTNGSAGELWMNGSTSSNGSQITFSGLLGHVAGWAYDGTEASSYGGSASVSVFSGATTISSTALI